MLIDPGCQIIDNKKKTGNVDGGKAWIFTSHTWVMLGDQPIDVLFGRYGKQPAKIGKKLGKDRFEFGDQQYVALGEVSDPTRKYMKVTGKLRNIL